MEIKKASRHFYVPFSKITVKIINLKIASKIALEIFHFHFITSCRRRKCDFFEGCPALLDLSVCDARARFGLRPRVESLSLRHFFFAKNGERRRKSSLHAFVSTKALHSKPKVFFTSSPNSGSLACEVVSFRYHSISLVKRSAYAAREVSASGGLMCFCLKRTCGA